MEPEQIAKTIADSPLLAFLAKSHEGKAPYYFRLELKSKMDPGPEERLPEEGIRQDRGVI